MIMNEQRSTQAQRFFLIGIALLGVLVIGGLIWAVSLGPSGPGPSSEANLHFNDDNDPAQGPADAKVTVRIFGDLQCPACKAAEPGFLYAIKTYSSRARFVWDDFPLTTVHPNAKIAAEAARCAEEQGKFWEYNHLLYQNQDSWAPLSSPSASFTTYASQLGLNTEGFSSCLAQQTYNNKIEDDMAEGDANNVNATPTFFINNQRYEGGMTNAQWDTAMDQAFNANP